MLCQSSSVLVFPVSGAGRRLTDGRRPADGRRLTDGRRYRGRNMRACVQITASSMIQWEKHRLPYAHRQQTAALLVDNAARHKRMQ